MSRVKILSVPFTHGIDSVPRTMMLVMLALSPATMFNLYQFGWPAIILFFIILGSSLLFEALSLLIARKPVTPFLLDGSAVLTGWLVAMALPPWAPWWIGVPGGFIVLGFLIALKNVIDAARVKRASQRALDQGREPTAERAA